jgi:hypothetical protein
MRIAGLGLCCALLGCTRSPATPSPAVTRTDAAAPSARTPATPTDAGAIHGTLSVVDGQRILRVWGTPTQMGHAHGALLRDAIVDVIEHYALQVVPPATLAATGAALAEVGDIAPGLREEAAGIVAGMREHGGAEVPSLGRELVADDLLALNAMTDLVAIGCSSLSSWGAGVTEDRDGAPMVVRNLDWSDDADLLEHQIILVTMPSDPTRQPVVSIGFAGYIACLSCLNEAGVTALFNMGYGEHTASLAGAMAGFAPANLLLRDALERRDVDGDGSSRADDVQAAITKARHVGSYIVHVVEPRHAESPARVLEVESDGVVVRGPESGLGPERLAATNHLREKAAPTSCSRYTRLVRGAHRTPRFDRAALWDLGRSVRLDEVVHTVLVEPATRELTLWLRRPGDAADDASPGVHHAWADLVPARE